ncbi:hypothetical protein [Blattabacterium cuenoti]|uniref:hypothetical protein n=1 Tax=Blattabacterium cuenoti TaxID=1653831 RepID=UPI00163C2AB8|nr:hypothetical protein [Blattabacterium cuenoti]
MKNIIYYLFIIITFINIQLYAQYSCKTYLNNLKDNSIYKSIEKEIEQDAQKKISKIVKKIIR